MKSGIGFVVLPGKQRFLLAIIEKLHVRFEIENISSPQLAHGSDQIVRFVVEVLIDGLELLDEAFRALARLQVVELRLHLDLVILRCVRNVGQAGISFRLPPGVRMSLRGPTETCMQLKK